MAVFISAIQMTQNVAWLNTMLDFHATPQKKIPWKIFHAESYSLKSEAIKRERFLKKQKNQDFN